MKKAIIYVRVSTMEQSFHSQTEDLEKYAKLAGINVEKVFGEKVSGYSQTVERTEYDLMKTYVEENNINVILCWELSRFGRNTLHTLNEIDYFRKKKVDIFFKKENIWTLSEEPTTKLVLTLLSSMAELERNSIIDRSIRGKLSAAEKGKRIGFAIMPYGFFADDKGFIQVNEDEAKNVRYMYDLFILGTSIREIANKLNSQGIQTRNTLRGKKRKLRSGKSISIIWRPNTLRKILTSTLYKGERTYIKTITIKIPQIVEEQVWDKAQEIFKTHIGYVNNTKYEYLFKSKIYCGVCGNIYTASTRVYPTYTSSFYSCSGRKDKGLKCKNGQVKTHFIDERIYDLLFRHQSVMLNVIKDKRKSFKVEERKSQIEFYLGEINKEEQKSKRNISLYKDGYIDKEEFEDEHKKIRNIVLGYNNNIGVIEREIEAFTDASIATTIGNLLDETNFDIKREFILKYVHKILIYTVTDLQIDFKGLSFTRMKDMKTIPFRSPHVQDKYSYIEIFAFGNLVPLKLCISNWSEVCYPSPNLQYDDGSLFLIKPQ